MRRFYKNFQKLSSGQHRFLARATGGMAALVLLASFISQGGMAQVTRALAMAHILPQSQTGCVMWGCQSGVYEYSQAMWPENSSGQVTYTFQPGQYIHFQWNAGQYGNNNFLQSCQGAEVGSQGMCTVAQGYTNTNWGTCSPSTQYCTGYTTTYTCNGYDGYGNCVGWTTTQTCNAYAYTTPSGCGNADIYWGYSCFGWYGGTTPSCPGWPGNWGDMWNSNSVNFTAPSTPGNYTYYFCSYVMLYEGMGCDPVTITVAPPPPTCSLTPSTQSINQAQNATLSYSDTNTSSVTYSVDGTNKGAPSGNPFTVAGSGMSVGSHTVTLNVSGSGGSGNCSATVNVTAAPAPSCTLTSISPATIGNGDYATFSYSGSNYVGTPTYQVDNGTAVTPGNNPFNVSGLAAGSHDITMTVINVSGIQSTCTGNVTVSSAAPTVSALAGGASSVTVPVNATTTLAWSSQGISPGGASLTAPSSGSNSTSFSSIASNVGTSDYFSGFFVANGNVYESGGDNGSAWVNTLWSAPVGADLTGSGAWTTVGTLPATVGASISQPLVLNGTVYQYGGYSSANGYTYNICESPVSGLSSVSSWSCPATLPSADGGTDVTQYVTAPVVIGDYIYVFGGYNSASGVGSLKSVLRAPVSDPTSFTYFPNVLPQALYGAGVAVVGNYVYLLGGYSTQSSAPLNAVYRASITSDLTVASSWSSAGVLPAAIHLPGIAVDANNLYVIGGYLTGGTQSNAIYEIPLSTLAAGNLTTGSWSSAGTLPVAMYPVLPFIDEGDLYLAGGYSSAGYINKYYYVPFNDGKAYTDTGILPWHTDGGTNAGSTWPINVTSVTYTLNASNPAGNSTATAVVNEPDLCTNWAGIQNPLPSGATVNGTTCSCSGSDVWNGSSCIASAPPSTITVTPSIDGGVSAVTRVRKGTSIKLYWNVSGLISGDTGTNCSISSSPSGAMTTQTWDQTTVPWTQGSTPPSVAINGTTVFTLTCSNANWSPQTKSVTVSVVPTYQEQ